MEAAFSYVRYSPRTGNGILVARQIRKMVLLLEPYKPKFFVDSDNSGWEAGMPRFRELLSTLATVKGPIVAIDRVLRLGRDGDLVKRFLLQLKRSGGELWVKHGVPWMRDETRLLVRAWDKELLPEFVEHLQANQQTLSKKLQDVAQSGMARGDKWGRPAKVNDRDVGDMAAMRNNGAKMAEIATEFNVSISTVHRRLKIFRDNGAQT